MSNPTTTSSDILIIGAGIFGTSTAYYLSLVQPASSRITVLDRSPYPPHHAASTDINKIVRADYTSAFYMDLATKAKETWETDSVCFRDETRGEGFFHKSGWVNLANEGNDIADRIRKNFKERGEDVTSDVEIDQNLREKWNGLLRDTEFETDPKIVKGYWNPDAGWADAGDAVENMMSFAIKNGVTYETGDVESLLVSSDNNTTGVRTHDDRIFSADKVLLATGAWTSSLMSPLEDALNIPPDERVEKQSTAAGVCVVHYKISDDEYARLKNMPVVIYGDRGEVQPPPAKTRLLKFTNASSFKNTISTPSGHRISVPPSSSQNDVPDSLKKETLDRIVAKTLPEYASRPVDHWRLCWDAITPTQDQLICRHPRIENLYFAVGGSFHSWKFLPIIGKYVVNVLDGVGNGEDMDKRWGWKTGAAEGRGAHEKVVPKRELGDIVG